MELINKEPYEIILQADHSLVEKLDKLHNFMKEIGISFDLSSGLNSITKVRDTHLNKTYEIRNPEIHEYESDLDDYPESNYKNHYRSIPFECPVELFTKNPKWQIKQDQIDAENQRIRDEWQIKSDIERKAVKESYRENKAKERREKYERNQYEMLKAKFEKGV
jgi:hypothetical protein